MAAMDLFNFVGTITSGWLSDRFDNRILVAVATVPPTVKLSGQHFGSANAPIVVGWVFAFLQFGGAIAAFAAGITRATWDTYLPAFVVIDAACLLATLAMFAVRDSRLQTVAAAR
jgi:MFS family permease